MSAPVAVHSAHTCAGGGGDCGPARVHTLSVHRQEDQGTHMCLGMSGEAACLHAVCLCVAHTGS